MNILTWNCNMAFRKKYQEVLTRKIDLAIILECENQEKLEKVFSSMTYNELIWYGNNIHKGVAVISFNDVSIEMMDEFNPEFEYILPIRVREKSRAINLMAIWAMPNKVSPSLSYVRQIWGAINYYQDLFKKPSILVGDFNSNVQWDTKRKIGNHSDMVAFLKKYDIVSIYHELRQLAHGDERQPTLYLLKNKNKKYHIDYCFTTSSMMTEQTTFKIGSYRKWIKFSDHMPVWIENI